MELHINEILSTLSDFVWNLLRVAGFFMTVPIFGNKLVPPRVRIALSMAVAGALMPTLNGAPDMSEWDLVMLADLVIQIFMGIGLGFSTFIFFQLFVVAGQFIGMQMGLGFAAMVDPGNGIQVTVWSQFFLMLVTLSFLVLNGHLVLLEILVMGFTQFSGAANFAFGDFAFRIVAMGGWMFMGGALVALPAVISLLIVNLSFGVMNRSAPQLNVFSLGFPFSLMFGLVIIWFLLYSWSDQFPRLLSEFFEHIAALIGYVK